MWRAGMGGREVGGMEWRMDGGMAEPGTAADLQGEALPSFPLTSLALVETQSLQTWFAKPKKRSGMLGNGYVCPPEMHKTSVGNLYLSSKIIVLKEYKLMSSLFNS